MAVSGKDLGNSMNKEALGYTITEVCRSTEQVECGFTRRKTTMNWTLAGLGQKMENKKKEYFNTVFPKRWASHRSYEMCMNFYKEAACHL